MDDTLTLEPPMVAAPTLLQASAAVGIAKWIGEKAAGAIVGSVCGEVFTSVMDAIGLGGPDLAGKLDQISSQITEVQKTLVQIIAATDAILARFDELKAYMAETLRVEKVATAIRRIEGYYGTPGLVALAAPAGSPVSLRQLTEVVPRIPNVTLAQLEEAAVNYVAYVRPAGDYISDIHAMLTDDSFGSDPLLVLWADRLATQINAKAMNRSTAYTVLEGYFLRCVAAQLKGMSVHCVALGKSETGQALVQDYLRMTFGPKIRAEARAFVAAVERMLFSTIAPTMPIGELDGKGSLREFPREIDQILLTADLLAAAIGLCGRIDEHPAPNLPAAIAGIYGRCLYRPSDLANGAPPAFAIHGYAAQAGTQIASVPLVCLDAYRTSSTETPKLRDAAASKATVAHYHWGFATAPQAGATLDPGQRDGVTTALYPVYGDDQPKVMAAGFLDVTRLYRALNPQTNQQESYQRFPSGGPHITIGDEVMALHRNPMTQPAGNPVFQSGYRAEQAWKSDARLGSSLTYKLFRYDGATRKVRLRVRVTESLFRRPRLDSTVAMHSQRYNLISAIDLRKTGGFTQRLLDSRNAYGADQPLNLDGPAAKREWGRDYNASRSETFSFDFELTTGDYELAFLQEAVFPKVHNRHSEWKGWNYSKVGLELHWLSLELLA